MKNKHLLKKICIHVFLAFWALVVLFPFYWMVLTSFKSYGSYNSEYIPKLFVSSPTLENYISAFSEVNLAGYFGNTVLFTVITTGIMLFVTILAAYAFARLKFKGRDKVFFVYLSTLMVPLQVTIIPLYMILRMLGWHDSYAALIVPPVFSAFGVFMLRQSFLTIPAEVEEAAKIDGCSRVAIFLRIILPMSKPGLASLAIFTFVNSWKSFFWPLIVTSSDKYKTLPIGLYAFSGQYGTDWSALMAATAISIIPGVIFYIIFQKSLVEGISLTGMGGR